MNRLYLLDIHLLIRAAKLAWWVQRKIGWRPTRTAHALVWVGFLLTLPRIDTYLAVGTLAWHFNVWVTGQTERQYWHKIDAILRVSTLFLLLPFALAGVLLLLLGLFGFSDQYPHSLQFWPVLLSLYVKSVPDGPDQPSELRQALDRLAEQFGAQPQPT